MPEGHTLHRMALDHTTWLGGHVVSASSPQGRFAHGAHVLDGAAFDRAEAKGKHLFWRFRGLQRPRVVHIHLGLFGRFKRYVRMVPEPRDTVRVRLRADSCTLDLTGPTACEILTLPKMRAIFDRLGEDPLRDDADPDKAWDRIHRSRRTMGALLLDQSIIAGVGNVYRAELLFLQRIPPSLPGNALSRAAFDALWEDCVRQLTIGVQTNRIITRGLDQPSARRRGERLWVYKQRACHECGGEITKSKSANRTLYACDRCQS